MSRFSKYMKEKLVKVLVAALVVGSVAGNGTITVQAEETETESGIETKDVSDGNAVVYGANGKQVQNTAVNVETVNISSILGAANDYGIFVSGTTKQTGDSEANICTSNFEWNANCGYLKDDGAKGTIYVDNELKGGNHLRCTNLIVNKAFDRISFKSSKDQNGNEVTEWYLDGNILLGNNQQIGKVEKGSFDLKGAFTQISGAANDLFNKGEELQANSEGKFNTIEMRSGQNIFKVNGLDTFQPTVDVNDGISVIFNIQHLDYADRISKELSIILMRQMQIWWYSILVITVEKLN